jgi:hypothetical protein
MRTQLPLGFFATAFFIILLGLYVKFTAQKTISIVPPAQQTLLSPTPAVPSLNYALPIACDLYEAQASFSATMRGSDIHISYHMSNLPPQTIAVLGDCLYQAEGAASLRKIKCGIGAQVSMAKQALSSGLLSPEMIQTTLMQTGKPLPFRVEKILQNCKNVR